MIMNAYSIMLIVYQIDISIHICVFVVSAGSCWSWSVKHDAAVYMTLSLQKEQISYV